MFVIIRVGEEERDVVGVQAFRVCRGISVPLIFAGFPTLSVKCFELGMSWVLPAMIFI